MNHANQRYGKVAQTFHWITALLVVAAFTLGPEGSELRVYAPEAAFQRQLHETLGSCVFALSLMRVLWVLVDRQRPQAPTTVRWMALAAKSMQGLIYVLLFAVPLTAVLGAWLQGHPVTLLAGLEIAPLFAKSNDLGRTLVKIHKLLGDSILWLAGLHAAAALFHHFFLRDHVLVSMLPRWLAPERRDQAV